MKPNPDIALIYHYDLARALAGEVVDWVAIPVNVQAGREGGDLCRLAADFGKRRDLFAMPAPGTHEVVRHICGAWGPRDHPNLPADWPMPPGCNLDSGHDGPHVGAFDITWSDSSAVPVSPVTVEQPAVDPRPDTASPPVAVSAADRERDLITYGRCWCGEPRHNEIQDDPNYQGGKLSRLVCYAGHDDYTPVAVSAAAGRDLLRARIGQLVAAGHEQAMRQAWPDGVKTLKHHDHDAYDLDRILAAVRRVEAEVGAGWHPDDGVEPRSAKAIRRAVDAWAGRDPGTAWFAASLIATFEQCRNADSTFEQLVASFSIEQCDRLHDAAQGITP